MRTYVCNYEYWPMRAVVHIAGGCVGTGYGPIHISLITFTPRFSIYVYTYIPINISKFPTNPFCQTLQGIYLTKKTIFSPSTKYIRIYQYWNKISTYLYTKHLPNEFNRDLY